MVARTFLVNRHVRLLAVAVLAAMLALLPIAAWAHPLGNFTVNRYSRVEASRSQIAVLYIVDMAEIPALQERQRMDANGDGAIDQAEQDVYRAALVAAIGPNLQLTVDQQQISLGPERAELSFPAGQGGLVTLRLEAHFTASMPETDDSHAVVYEDTNFADRIGWSEVIVRGNGVDLRDSSAPSEDLSDELRNYPADLLQAPPSITRADFGFTASAANNSNPQNPSPISTSYPQFEDMGDRFAAIVTAPLSSPAGILLALAGALGLGAAHALAPGHGKTIVAAYLVGARGTPWHALFLGLTTTVTHTAGVFALGFITLFVSQFVLPERLYPWLSVASGVLVVAVGWGLLRVRLAAIGHGQSHVAGHAIDGAENGRHSHGFGLYHSHTVPSAAAPQNRSSLRNLLLLGVSGGLIPCPSALVVLLGAIAIGRVGFGLLLILAFSLGLAGVLTLIGLALVYARRLFERVPTRGPILRILPVASALIVMLAGAGMTAQALLSVFRQ